ncbi:MAG TPA: ribonucleoside triphosphate reductase [Candidatus Goldiibacteriota bacterium]|nr:ribonucleoside triphosphate reductase [Candidatus Goldiibacteriota bacterium]
MAKVMYILKRNGELVPFEEEKITNAIFKAFKANNDYDREKAEKISAQVTSIINVVYKDGKTPTVENVQDIVETTLLNNGYTQIAKSYILYRDQHAKMRDVKNLLKDSTTLVDDYLRKLDWRIKENSNMSYSLQGLNNHVSSIITSTYWLNKIYTPEIKQAHIDGDLHLHDLGLLSVYCCGWDLKDLLFRGFGGVEGKIESAPPSHFESALGQVVNFFYTLQGEAAGAQAFANFDTLLAPFIRHNGLSYEEVKRAMRRFLFNMNIPTRVGFQTPFTNITMDLTVPGNMKDEAVVINGEIQNSTYGEYQEEMYMLNRAFAEVMLEGDSKGRIFTFPIPTYNITRDFDWDNRELDPVWEMTAKYGIPYFANFVNSDMSPDDARSMCCRLRLDNRELRKRGGGLFGSNPLTGSIGVVTINMPRLGYKFKGDKAAFYKELVYLMDLAKESLEIKRKMLEKLTENGLYPYSRHYLEGIKSRTGRYWTNHFSTIGLIGMNESLINFMDKDITTEEGKAFTIEVLEFMRDRLMDYQKETGNFYNLEATPGEGTSYRLAKIDREKFPQIRTMGAREPYYTNSTQLPVFHTKDVFRALEHQDPIQTKYTGGTVFHVFLGERISTIEATKSLVRRIAERFRLPYYSLTPTFSVCPVHGYLAGEHKDCPVCRNEMQEKIRNQITELKEKLTV